MARNPQERPDAEELIRRIGQSRSELGHHASGLRRKLDVRSRVRNSVLQSPLAWFGGSLGVGLLASRIFRHRPRKKEKKKHSGLVASILIALFSLLKPALKSFLMAQAQRCISKATTRSDARPMETQLPLSNPETPPSK